MKYRWKGHRHYKRKSPKRGLISVKDLTMELPEGRESLYALITLTNMAPEGDIIYA